MMINTTPITLLTTALLAFLLVAPLSGCWLSTKNNIDNNKTITLLENSALVSDTPLTVNYTVSGSLVKKVLLELETSGDYASVSILANDSLLLDNIDVPKAGKQQLIGLVRFDALGSVKLSIKIYSANAVVKRLVLTDTQDIEVPHYQDITAQAGIDQEISLKYGGPTIADLNNDGHYDFILNNHNDKPTRLYWNQGDGTVVKNNKDLARWFMQDLHGTAAGDYDNDGDLDLMVMMGGGNGTAPTISNFYNNDKGNLVLYTGDVGIDKGGRGRAAKWVDMDVDGDLDLMLINESSLTHAKPQHLFYENLGNGKFQYKPIVGLQDQEGSRVLLTDLNGDNIDDVILYGSSLSVWQGNGNFTFTDITAQFPADIRALTQINAITDIDIDNDGDYDLYLARGKEFEHGKDEAPAIDLDPLTQEFGIKTRAAKGVDEFSFSAAGKINVHQYYYLTQGAFAGKEYPVFLGANKIPLKLSAGGELHINPLDAKGWPSERSADGLYFGYLGESKGNGQWQAALVRNSENMFWSYRFSLSGVTAVKPNFTPDNRNIDSFLLRNDGKKFTDVSAAWKIPAGGNSMGVTVGDFNNDSFQDLLIYRWGKITSRGSDLMLLNTGKGEFLPFTQHGASDTTGPGNGDMGQAFDFDLDGKVDVLSGSELGEWYLYKNTAPVLGNYALVNVGYSPKHHVDPLSAEIMVTAAGHEYRHRVGSAGSVFSQSLLNIVHVGLGKENNIERIQVRWRNGETVELTDLLANKQINIGIITPKNKLTSAKISISDQSTKPIEPSIAAYINIVDQENFSKQEFKVGEKLQMTVNYHAGSGNKIIAADEGGIRFWLRLFKSKWIPAKDIVLTDASVLGTESGQATMDIPLNNVTPTANLPEGYFYALRASFMGSDGDMHDVNVYPINIVKAK